MRYEDVANGFMVDTIGYIWYRREMDTNTETHDYAGQISNMSATYGKLLTALMPTFERYIDFLKENKNFILAYIPYTESFYYAKGNDYALAPLQLFSGYVTFSPKQNYDNIILVPNAYIKDPKAWEEWVIEKYNIDYLTVQKAIGDEKANEAYDIVRIETICFENASNVLKAILGLRIKPNHMIAVYINKKTGEFVQKEDIGREIHSSYDSMCFTNK